MKERLLQKLKEMYSEMDKKMCEVSHKQEVKETQNFEKYNKMREQSISLKNACFALAAALEQEYEL